MAKPCQKPINTHSHSDYVNPGIFKERFRSIEKLRHRLLYIVQQWLRRTEPSTVTPELESRACVSCAGKGPHTAPGPCTSCCFPSPGNHWVFQRGTAACLCNDGKDVGGGWLDGGWGRDQEVSKLQKKEKWPSLCHLRIRAWRLLLAFPHNFECSHQYWLVDGKLSFKTTHQLSGPYLMLVLERSSLVQKGELWTRAVLPLVRKCGVGST